MNRREFVIASTAGITTLAGCSGSNEINQDEQLQNEIRDLIESANGHAEQGSRNLQDAQGFVNQERWGNAAGSAGDAAESFSTAEGDINTAINRAEQLDDSDIVDFLEDYQSFLRAATSTATSFEQGAEAMVEGDSDSAQSHFERAKEDLDEMESLKSDIEDYDF